MNLDDKADLRLLAVEWIRLADQEIDAGAESAYRHCASMLVALIGGWE